LFETLGHGLQVKLRDRFDHVGDARIAHDLNVPCCTRRTIRLLNHSPKNVMQEFELRGEWIALDDLLKVTGLASSGGAAKAMIADGQVKLDGVLETRKTKKIRAGQMVWLGSQRILVKASSSSEA
jgi:ribosome-associated protein